MKKNKKKIWIIDDDVPIVEYLKIALEDEGYFVLTSKDGETFEKRLKNNPPDLILLDFLLPGKNGDSVINSLRKNKRTKDIPVILISAHQEVRKIAQEIGANQFLSKPFDIDSLLSLIKKQLF